MASFALLPADVGGGFNIMGRINPFTGHKYSSPSVLFHERTLEEAEKKLKETRAKYKEGAAAARAKDKAFLDSLTPEERAAAGLKPKKEPKPKAPAKPRKKKGEATAEPVAEA